MTTDDIEASPLASMKRCVFVNEGMGIYFVEDQTDVD